MKTLEYGIETQLQLGLVARQEVYCSVMSNFTIELYNNKIQAPGEDVLCTVVPTNTFSLIKEGEKVICFYLNDSLVVAEFS